MKTMNKLLSLLLCAIMVFSMLPVQAFATETEIDSQSQVTEATEVEVTEEVSSTEDSDNQTVLGGGTTEPSEETTEASEETTEATQASTEATQETTEATEESTEATQETTVATETAAQVAAVSAEVEVQAVAEDNVAKIGDVGYATLAEAVAAAQDGDTIVILKSMDIATAIAIKTNVTITAESDVTLTRTGTNDVFDVSANATLTLSGPITLVGSTKYGTMVDVLKNGTFIMNDGVVIKDNQTQKPNYAGGVTVTDGTFIMNGGAIQNCGNTGSSKPGSTGGGSMGGGVRIIASKSSTAAASFSMNGGTISGCSAYNGGGIGLENKGAKVAATVTINGGSVTGCSQSASGSGVGGSAIFIYNKVTAGNKTINDAVVTMNGGSVTGNIGKKYGTLGMYVSGTSYGGKYNIYGGTISGNFVGSGSNNSPSSFGGNGIYVDRLIGGQPVLTIGGSAVIDDEIFLKSTTGNYFEILDNFTGSANVFAQAAKTGKDTSAYGTLVAKATNGTATAEIAGRLTVLYHYLDGANGASGNRYAHPVYGIVLSESAADEYVLGAPAVIYTVTYTDGVEGEEIFADQVYTVEENEATPAFEGETPARTGYTFGSWTPDVAETVTADVTYTAVWNVCEHQWGEPVVDETAATITKTCAVCGAVEVVNVVAKIESTGTYYETLQAAVDAAITLMATSEQETITMVNDTKESVEISWLGINACNLTIDFAGHTVTGNGGSVFTVNRYTSYKAKMTVFFNDSVGGGTVTGGAAEKGGAIYAAKGAPVIIINGGTWTGNTATNGGVIYVSGQTSGSVTINGGTFTGNTAEKNGGAIYARYLTVAGGTITGNTAASGGGVYAFSGYSQKFDMAGGAVYGNTATVDGDDIIWRANQGNTSTSYLKLIAASDMNAGVQNWYHDNEGSRFSVDNAIVFEDYAKYTTRKIRVALKAAGAICTITYTDGVEGEELFADQSYKAVSGTATPAFEGTPTREGYEFAGWTPEFSETVTGDVAYTATWAPAAPDKYGKNVINPLVTVICDSDEDHAPVTGKWYPQNCKILPSGSKPVWDETLGTWTIGVRLDSLTMFYVSELEDAYNNIHHELANEKTYIDTTLKWDAEQLLWVPTEALEVHATCQTMPTAPTHIQLKSYQIKVHGTVDGEDKVYTTSIPEGSYVVGEVKGSREEGFTVDVTVTIENDDLFITNWIAKRDPGVAYVYDWDKTPATVTFTLTYNGSLTGTLYGDRHGSNNYDWIIGFNYKNQPLTYGAVADAYVEKAWFVTYTDGIEGEEIFADQVYRVGDGNNTPAFDSIPTREGYVFAGWEPAVAETVTADVTYVAQWKEYFEVVVYSVTDGNKDKAEQIFAGDILEGENLTEWLDENVEIAEVVGYTVDKWYNWDAYGEKIADTTVVDGAVNVYITYTVNTYTVTLDPAGGEVEPTRIKVTYGKAVGELPVPTREGYTFAGWVVAESKTRAVFDTAGTVVTAETVYDVAADSTLVAQWTANEYTVTLDPNGGELTEDELEVTYGEPVGKLPAPTRDGYYFAGWVDKDGKAVTEETLYGVAGDSTIIATWQKIYIKDPSSPATGDTGITMTAIVCMLSGALLLVLMSQKKRLFR